ncbi:hypothetical protein [Shewanella surugensis]|uniref:Uncharacterized protein n=1 Tax=Shewanella surugensis TaxID=212020 RepID=A0ABT0L9D0_9GAMM|nr:hypothetical protein [Shewanella surugensis]MCL1124301.1 hypothetical protein [Shewanella surugensis]
MKTINIKSRLRPIRFAFLVRPTDKKNIEKIFRINTCLWGGLYNPIIPVFGRTPTWWSNDSLKRELPSEALNRYLDFFEPDILVECEKGLARNSGYDSRRVINLEELLVGEGHESWNGFGLDTYDLYNELYDNEYKYQLRTPHNITIVEGKSAVQNMLVSCLFGKFPEQKEYSYYERVFKDNFDAHTIKLEDENLDKIYREGITSPIRMANKYIKRYSNNHMSPTLFVFDLTKPYDLIDYWNLRAVYANRVIPIPKQWISQLSAYCKEFILKNYRPLPGNRYGVMIRPQAMFSRGIEDEEANTIFENHIKVDREGANCIQHWYPRFDVKAYKGISRDQRPLLTVEERDAEYSFDDNDSTVKLDTLKPSFVNNHRGNCKWANVIKLRSWIDRSINTVFPIDFRNPKFPRSYMGGDFALPTSEGLTLLPRAISNTEYVEIKTCSDAISTWLKSKDITTVQSDAGRSTQQIIDTLGGFWGVRALTSKKVIEELNKIAMKPASKTDNVMAFRNKIIAATKNKRWKNRSFDQLVNNGAVELGAEIKCTECGHPSWFELPKLDHSLKCDLCMRLFDFPKVDTKNHLIWAYRLIGPFALPNYAKGGYSASLSIRFFSEVIGEASFSNMSWSAGRELTYSDGKKIEADYLLWLQQTSPLDNHSQARLVFGEAKSFAKEAIGIKDISAMKELAQRHPGAVLVFSLLKTNLSKSEKARLAKLALWGREIDRKTREQKAIVIVLTGIELFSVDDFSLEDAWKNATSKHKSIVEIYRYELKDIDVLADATQQIYLGLPSYGDWWHKKFIKNKT